MFQQFVHVIQQEFVKLLSYKSLNSASREQEGRGRIKDKTEMKWVCKALSLSILKKILTLLLILIAFHQVERGTRDIDL